MKWLDDKGKLNIEALDQLAADLKAVTDSTASLDQVVKDAKLGRPTVVAFRCSHTGMFFPSDYVKQWGSKYGIGLGSSPISESLNSQYDVAPPSMQGRTKSNKFQMMHPLESSKAQIDYVIIPEDEYKANSLIIANEDEDMSARVQVLYDKQMVHPRSQLRLLMAQYNLTTGVK